jgi:hypothetical protein
VATTFKREDARAADGLYAAAGWFGLHAVAAEREAGGFARAERLLDRFVAPRGAKPPRQRPPGASAASKLTAAMTRTIPVTPVAAARPEIVRPRGVLAASRIAANEK